MTVSRTDDLTETLQPGTDRARTLEAFFEAHYTRLVGLAGLVCGEVASAEDIVQTALERAWRSRGSLHDEARLRPWLDRVVVREAARERRARLTWLGRLVRPPTVGDISAEYLGGEDPAAGGFPDRSALRSAFEGLTVAQRAVVVLHLHVGYTVDETAAALGVPRETVRSRLRVAREQLRHVLRNDDRRTDR
jgi:RNA polymerase sigma-70 factor, ECF subfamily